MFWQTVQDPVDPRWRGGSALRREFGGYYCPGSFFLSHSGGFLHDLRETCHSGSSFADTPCSELQGVVFGLLIPVSEETKRP